MFSIGKFVRNLRQKLSPTNIMALAMMRSPWFVSFVNSHRGISPAAIVGVAVGVLMLGILLPIGLSAWEHYTPTGATLLVIWPIGAVLIVLGIVLGFYRDNS